AATSSRCCNTRMPRANGARACRGSQGVDPNVLQNQGATIANQMFNAAQANMKMIARIFAETGIRDLFALLHAVVRKHGSHPPTGRARDHGGAVSARARGA